MTSPLSPAPAEIRLDRASAEAPAVTLGGFAFGSVRGATRGARFDVPLSLLDGAVAEDWIVGGAIDEQVEQDSGLRIRRNAEWLMGELVIDPARVEDDIERTAFEAYARVREFVAHSEYPYLVRMWNFFDRLNEGEGDDERYRRFCVGRHSAIASPGFELHLPAASVIGSRVPGLYVSFLAGRERGSQIENPRQTSAFRYPRDYGPISPSFSRATRIGHTLLVSGTAAVVGHETQHPGDAAAQLDEIAANLRALLDRASQDLGWFRGRWHAQALRLYLRNEADAAALPDRLREALGESGAPLAVLRGDISRADLMLEVEGVWQFRSETSSTS
jgi:chorismate lyase/3-hydroxybenzoate synthase